MEFFTSNIMKNVVFKKLSLGKLGVMSLDLPYLIIGKGRPRGLILGLEHGNELSSLAVIAKFLESKKLYGQAVIVSVANPFGLLFGERNEPFDEKDLNRNFPGKEKGDLAQRLAAALFFLAKSCDFVVDLHSFRNRLTEIICGFTETNDARVKNRVIKMIKAMEPDFVWKIDLRDKDDKRFYGTLDQAMARVGIPAIFVETPNLQFISDTQIQRVDSGLVNIFKQFDKRGGNKKIFAFSAQYVFADQSGLFVPGVFPKAKVKAGEVLGEVLVLPNFKKTKIKSPYQGVVMSIQSKNFIRLGTKLASIGKFAGNI